MQSFYSHGKLLLTGEYVVLDGALSLAVPTKFGQSIIVNPLKGSTIHWKSLDFSGKIWFEDTFELKNNSLVSKISDNDTATRLCQILNECKLLNPEFLIRNQGFEIKTKLEFPNNWGLGTSSTLINNIAKWVNVNPYELLERTFGGSGYDIACANSYSSITYQLYSSKNDKYSELTKNTRTISKVSFNPSFADSLFFIHLNAKQDSRKGIKRYQSKKGDLGGAISRINSITEKIINCNSLKKFEILIQEHESIISELIQLNPIKRDLFRDYKGAVKSLGAWGGDFILATGKSDDMNYFKEKVYLTILPYRDMVK